MSWIIKMWSHYINLINPAKKEAGYIKQEQFFLFAIMVNGRIN